MVLRHQDYYQVLGVATDASQSEIRASYHRLAAAHHPDKNPGDEQAAERFRQACEAYQTLSDPDLRTLYDQARTYQHPRITASPVPEDRSVKSQLRAFVDNFRRAAGPRPRRGPDLHYRLQLDLADVARGGTFAIEVRAEPGSRPRRVRVSVPPGISDGASIKLSGQGGAGKAGAAPGDLFVSIGVLAHGLFSRQGSDLSFELFVPVTTAALGGEAKLPTLEGPTSIRIPAGTQSGQVLGLKGRGLIRSNGKDRGDLLVTVRVEVPVNLSDSAKQTLRDLQASCGEGQYPAVARFRKNNAS